MIEAFFVLEIYERTRVRRNARLILQCSTAYPFKLPEDAQVCVYCYDRLEDPAMFRKHMDEEHSTFKVEIAFAHIVEGYLKVDITELRCRMCLEQFKTLEQVTEHLNSVHNVGIDVDYELGVQPFILENSKWDCAICNERFTNLRALSRHTQKHFVKFTCDACGKSYSTSTSLKHHIARNHNVSRYVCRKCKKPFNSSAELRDHMLGSKRCLMHVCNVCNDRFYSWRLKQTHMIEAHGVPEKSYECQECSAVFTNGNTYRNHFKITHTTEHFVCSCCGRRFETKYKLGRHMVTHTGEKQYACEVCSKRFPRKSTLDQHMWIHMTNKKWQCKTCDKQFNQRVSWKTHMKSHHPELCDF